MNNVYEDYKAFAEKKTKHFCSRVVLKAIYNPIVLYYFERGNEKCNGHISCGCSTVERFPALTCLHLYYKY